MICNPLVTWVIVLTLISCSSAICECCYGCPVCHECARIVQPVVTLGKAFLEQEARELSSYQD